MYLVGIRKGQATSSSSTHSVVYGLKSKRDQGVSGGGYGWDCFVCASKEAKIHYLLTSILSYGYCSDQGIDRGEIASFLEKHFDIPVADGLEMMSEIWPNPSQECGSYIDHQSHPGVNVDNYREALLNNWVDVINNPDLAIVGGNDNGGEFPEDSYLDYIGPTDSTSTLMKASRYAYKIKRQTSTDPESDLLVTMSTKGTKLYFSKKEKIDFTKFNFYSPELIDVKITDKCYKGCEWCYQKSTRDGEHCTLDAACHLSKALSIIKPFEIVLGGGEPSIHPYFKEIVNLFKKTCVLLSVTTKSEYELESMLENQDISRIGYSISNMEEYKSFLNHFTYSKPPTNKITLHLIPALWDKEEFTRFLQGNVNYDILLLGYKRSGTDSVGDVEYRQTREVEMIKDLFTSISPNITVSMDSTLVLNPLVTNILKANKVDERLYTSYKEGITSKYVDLVERKIKVASYSKQEFGDLTENTATNVTVLNLTIPKE